MSANIPPIFQSPPYQSSFFEGMNKAISWPWTQWFQNVQVRLTTPIPVAPTGFTSAYQGTPGQMFRDPAGTFLYICIATNVWKRTALAAF